MGLPPVLRRLVARLIGPLKKLSMVPNAVDGWGPQDWPGPWSPWTTVLWARRGNPHSKMWVRGGIGVREVESSKWLEYQRPMRSHSRYCNGSAAPIYERRSWGMPSSIRPTRWRSFSIAVAISSLCDTPTFQSFLVALRWPQRRENNLATFLSPLPRIRAAPRNAYFRRLRVLYTTIRSMDREIHAISALP